MGRIENTFKKLNEKGETALVGFVTAGDPDRGTSEKIITAMCEGGIDILELGVPFSDPTADGPVIQRSSSRAIRQGMTLAGVLEMIAGLRKKHEIPVIVFSYYNPILAYGNRRFYKDAVAVGADGVLVVDLPPEESDELTDIFDDTDFSLIRLVAPTTPKQRMKNIAENASGFIYLVSKTGVTGSDGLDTTDIRVHTDMLKSVTTLPICVGFGISTPDDVARMSKMADGVVIGSAFERTIETNIKNPDLPALIAEQTRAYKAQTGHP
ncbi:MAG: tryptophan synthase subunit alpha [Deltaproteobacteria bacterium]|nr:tryptophan synthase subunit alpha [Deltaproteobacteria bacterium]